MNKFHFSYAQLSILLMLFISIACKKETLQDGLNSTNKPPLANAGPDKIIALPTDSVWLDGSSSIDLDGDISQWQWTKISGPSLFQIVNQNTTQTSIINLLEGSYQFELKVTDSYGLFDTDTILVIVNTRPQKPGNVNFYFPDPTGTMSYVYSIFTNPSPSLITISINDTSGILSGVWCNTCAPRCPISSDYQAETGNYIDFSLPPGIYNWTAASSIFSFAGYPGTTSEFRQFFSTTHSTGGILTVNPGDSCILVKLVF